MSSPTSSPTSSPRPQSELSEAGSEPIPVGAIYRRDGDQYAPLSWAGGPWSPDHQHGGAVNALLASAVEEAATEAGFTPVRISVDLLRPVPMRSLRLEWAFVRRGRRMAVIEVRLLDSESEEPRVAQATAVLFAPTPGMASSWAPDDETPPGPEQGQPVNFMHKAFRESAPPGFHWSLEIRAVEGTDGQVSWMGTPLDLIEGEPMTPLQRLAAITDLTYGLSARTMLMSRAVDTAKLRHHMINTDTTLYLERPPVGKWFCFQSGSVADRDGIGIADVVLYDEAGRCGRSMQALLANPR